LQAYEQQLHDAQTQIKLVVSPGKLKEFLKLQPKISQWLDSQEVDFKVPYISSVRISTTLTINNLQLRAIVIDDGGYHPKDYRVEVYSLVKYTARINERALHDIVTTTNPRVIKRLLENHIGLSSEDQQIGDSPKSDHHEMMDHWDPIYLIVYWFLSAVMSLESGF
jgi:hypothetical protein